VVPDDPPHGRALTRSTGRLRISSSRPSPNLTAHGRSGGPVVLARRVACRGSSLHAAAATLGSWTCTSSCPSPSRPSAQRSMPSSVPRNPAGSAGTPAGGRARPPRWPRDPRAALAAAAGPARGAGSVGWISQPALNYISRRLAVHLRRRTASRPSTRCSRRTPARRSWPTCAMTSRAGCRCGRDLCCAGTHARSRRHGGSGRPVGGCVTLPRAVRTRAGSAHHFGRREARVASAAPVDAAGIVARLTAVDPRADPTIPQAVTRRSTCSGA
jgi:hypothetical protein